MSSLHFSHLVRTSNLSVSKSFLSKLILFVVEPFLVEIQRIRDMGVLQFQSLSRSLLLKLIDTIVKRFHLVFLLHKFRPCVIKQMILVTIKKRFCNFRWISNSLPKKHYSRNRFSIRYFGLFWKTCSDSIHCRMKTVHHVALKRQDLEKNLTSSFLVLSEKLVFVVHVLLASEHFLHQVSPILRYTMVKPASYEVVRLRGPSRVALQFSAES